MQLLQVSKDDSEDIVITCRSWQWIYRRMAKDEYFNALTEKS